MLSKNWQNEEKKKKNSPKIMSSVAFVFTKRLAQICFRAEESIFLSAETVKTHNVHTSKERTIGLNMNLNSQSLLPILLKFQGLTGEV
jgi:hypothetical protein